MKGISTARGPFSGAAGAAGAALGRAGLGPAAAPARACPSPGTMTTCANFKKAALRDAGEKTVFVNGLRALFLTET